ncbi:DNA/RNA nuclease SfsA [Zobellella endophytica]|uniref:Sugar fermentation stimulation protein homolog n=1 Tax=Zobellella endophytica TaxID=2116700 RepID=A0A2P7QWQ3_9GAMM|nr:DNA/RNA nuclease SfsA [Zobellella endophytica]PSJ42408.1 DNA/RNA nuclease SfsA [Zobellella endophytica]
MQFSSLCRGRLVRRYKRFLADVLYQDQPLTLHCPNTGRMTGCAEPGWAVYFSTSANPRRKYAHTWELVADDRGHFICVNTARANQLAAETLAERHIPELAAYSRLESEVRYGEEGSRIDFLLGGDGLPDCYIEVKSVTLLEQDGQGYFPDTVSLRAQKHVRELIGCARAGHRAVMLFCVLHTGIERVSSARHLDPAYGRLIDEALAAGVECLAWQAEITPDGMRLARTLPFIP